MVPAVKLPRLWLVTIRKSLGTNGWGPAPRALKLVTDHPDPTPADEGVADDETSLRARRGALALMGRHAEEADALRADMAACLRALSGDGEADGPGVEALLAAFLERAGRLQNAFAAAAMQQEAGLGGADDDSNPAALRAEVEALRTELADKESLLTAHRTNVQRWLAECQSVADHTNSTAP